MSGSISLKEKFEVLMKNFQAVSSTIEELKQRLEESEGQNAYLRKQLGKPLKLKQKSSESSMGQFKGEGSEAEGHPREISSEEEVLRLSKSEWMPIATNFNDFKVEIPKFEGKRDSDEFLEWSLTVENISLSTRRCRMIRRLNLLLLDYESAPHCGRLNFVPNRLKITNAKFVHGRK